MLGDLVENTGRFDVIVGHLIDRGESLCYFSANRSARELRMGLIMRRGRPESERRNLLMRPDSRLTERQWRCFRALSHSTGRLGFGSLRSPAKQIDKGGGAEITIASSRSEPRANTTVRPKAAIAMMTDMIIVHFPRSPRINLSSSAQDLPNHHGCL